MKNINDNVRRNHSKLNGITSLQNYAKNYAEIYAKLNSKIKISKKETEKWKDL